MAVVGRFATVAATLRTERSPRVFFSPCTFVAAIISHFRLYMLALSTVEPIGLQLPGSLSDPLELSHLSPRRNTCFRARACASQPCLAAFPSCLGVGGKRMVEGEAKKKKNYQARLSEQPANNASPTSSLAIICPEPRAIAFSIDASGRWERAEAVSTRM